MQGATAAANLIVSGALVVGTTNVLSALNLKANASDVYTRAQTEAGLQPKIYVFDAPLNYTQNLLTGVNSLSSDSTSLLSSVSRIMCTNTSDAPTLSYRSEGTKLVLYDNLSGSTLDYSIGVEPYNMFFTVADSLSGFKFYGGPTCCTTLGGNGNITTIGLHHRWDFSYHRCLNNHCVLCIQALGWCLLYFKCVVNHCASRI